VTEPSEPNASQPNASKPNASQPNASPEGHGQGDLPGYLRANRGRFTDEALARAAREAGYADDAIQAAMADLPDRTQTGAAVRRRAHVLLIGSYAITYGLLTLGMTTGTTSGMDFRPVGVAILSAALGLAFLVSLAWLGNARLPALLVVGGTAIFIAVGFLPVLTIPEAYVPIEGIVTALVVGIALALFLRWIGRSRSARAGAYLAVGSILAFPLVLLIAIAGACVLTGLPIPSAA
jgi:hypothetical protein